MHTQTCNTQLKQLVRLCTDIHIFSTCQGMPGTTASGRKRVGRGTENEIPKETRDEALHEKLSVPQFGLCGNFSKCPSNHSHAICDMKSRQLLSQSHLQIDLIKTLAAQIFPCLILHTETSNTFEDIIPKASMQASTDHTCCPPPYAPPLAPLHCPRSQSH